MAHSLAKEASELTSSSNEPPRKRRRTSSINNKNNNSGSNSTVTTTDMDNVNVLNNCKVFDNDLDNDEYLSIYEALLLFPWRQTYKLFIPNEILKIIAYQATGSMFLCDKCNIKSFIIHDPKLNYNQAEPEICQNNDCKQLLACCYQRSQIYCPNCHRYYCCHCWLNMNIICTGLYLGGHPSCCNCTKKCHKCTKNICDMCITNRKGATCIKCNKRYCSQKLSCCREIAEGFLCSKCRNWSCKQCKDKHSTNQDNLLCDSCT